MSLSVRRVFVPLLGVFLLTNSAAPAASEPPPPVTAISGVVLDGSGAVIPGAAVTLRAAGQRAVEMVTDRAGTFVFSRVAAGTARLSVTMQGFSPATVKIGGEDKAANLRIVLQPLPLSTEVTVRPDTASAPRILSATRTDTPLRDVPQAVSILTRDLLAAQGAQSLADVVRYVPGVGMAQGEGNRDAAIFRGNTSTADFFVDGVRDDVQYYRDVYNVERVEVLKGANAMIFGRGGAGGVLNRVTREATWSPVREVAIQAGSFDNRRATLDVGQALTGRLAARMTALYEHSGSYRDGAGLERYGLNPTVAAMLGPGTVLTLGYERFHDSRTADRGIPSYQGRPVRVDPSTFFGDPAASRSRADVDAFTAAVQASLGRGVVLRNRTRFADYDKAYQNVYPASVSADGTAVSLSAYNNATTRRNFFSQTDVVASVRAWRTVHTVLAGVEIGRQATANLRNTGYFGQAGTTSAVVPLDAPTVAVAAVFRPSATDADNRGVANVRAIYVQDQAELSRWVRLIAGVRYETFHVDAHNNRAGSDYRSVDRLLSPRLGVVFKPATPISLYASYTLAYLPRAGEQLSSLTLSNQALDPEQFRNYEAGAKWDVRSDLSLTAAIYRLDRRNVAVPDPLNPSRSQLVDGQETSGLELEASGRITRAWHLIGGYAHQRGEITRSLSATAQAGARLAQLPAQTFSLWNRVDLTRTLGTALGVIRRGDAFTATDNTVVLPAFTRVDGAVYLRIGRRLRVQANIENLFDGEYYPAANGNNNITPGSPRAVRVVLTTSF